MMEIASNFVTGTNNPDLSVTNSSSSVIIQSLPSQNTWNMQSTNQFMSDITRTTQTYPFFVRQSGLEVFKKQKRRISNYGYELAARCIIAFYEAFLMFGFI